MLAEQKREYRSIPLPKKSSRPKMKVVPRSNQQLAVKVVLMSVCLLIFAVCFAYVAIESKIYNAGYAINETRAAISEVESMSARVGLEVDSLSSMERIEPLALAMGMIYPDNSDKVFIAYTPPVINDNGVTADVSSESTVADEMQEASWGSQLLQIIGSLLGGHFGIGE